MGVLADRSDGRFRMARAPAAEAPAQGCTSLPGAPIMPAERHSVDTVIVALLVGSFATLVTVHLALAAGLVRRRPHWRGAAALLLPPLAPYWGFRVGMRKRVIVWVAALSVYAVSLVAVTF